VLEAALAVAELYFDAMYFTLESGLPFDEENRAARENFFRFLVVTSPAMRLYWSRHSNLYGARISNRLEGWLQAETR